MAGRWSPTAVEKLGKTSTRSAETASGGDRRGRRGRASVMCHRPTVTALTLSYACWGDKWRPASDQDRPAVGATAFPGTWDKDARPLVAGPYRGGSGRPALS